MLNGIKWEKYAYIEGKEKKNFHFILYINILFIYAKQSCFLTKKKGMRLIIFYIFENQTTYVLITNSGNEKCNK